MTNNTNTPTSDLIDFRIKNRLINEMGVSDEELTYLARLNEIRLKQRTCVRGSNNTPSVVIAGFLYHGDLGHATDMYLLIDLGIRHIINICDCPLETEITDNFDVLWIDVADDLHTNISQHFQKTNEFLLSCEMKNEKVLVHCQAGISRSSSIVLAYLMKYHHATLATAYSYLLERRLVAAPNSGFLVQLIRYEKELRKSGASD